MGETSRLALYMIGPGTLTVFALGFLWAWQIERRRHYLLLMAAACILFASGALTQILQLPQDVGANAVLSNFFYISSVLAVAEGLLRRSGKRMGIRVDLVLIIVFSLAIWYYFYVDRQLLARIYIQNFGFGLILLTTALRLVHLARGRSIDRALFWVLLLFAVQFFPRTVATVGLNAPDGASLGESLFWQMLQLSLAVLGSGLALVMLTSAMTDVIEDLRRERDIDRLTGVLNRRGFESRVTSHSANASCRVALVICDLDHFKQINDTFGHLVGDEVLREFGALLRRYCRKRDLVGRIGGEEFAIFLSDTNEEDAHAFVDRLRLAIREAEFPFPRSARMVTASFGIAVARDEDRNLFDDLLLRADRALYAAKNSGRDRIVMGQSA